MLQSTLEFIIAKNRFAYVPTWMFVTKNHSNCVLQNDMET